MKTTTRYARPIVPRNPFILHGTYAPGRERLTSAALQAEALVDETLRMEMPFPSVPEIPGEPGAPSPSGPADPTGPEPNTTPQDWRTFAN